MNTVKCPGTVVTIAGQQYVMPPITLGAIEREGEAFTEMAEGRLPISKLAFVAGLVTEALRRNYPDVDSEPIANGVDLGNLQELVSALMTTTGLVRTIEASAESAAA